MTNLPQLSPETLNHIAAYLDADDALCLATTHSALRGAAQRSIFRRVAFEEYDGRRYLTFVLAILTRRALGAYVTSLSIRQNFRDCKASQLSNALELLDILWPHLRYLKHLTLTPQSLPPLKFEGCTDSLVEIVLPHCDASIHELLIRNRGLRRVALGEAAPRHACSLPLHSFPELDDIGTRHGSICRIIPTFNATHLTLLGSLPICVFMADGPLLAAAPGPLRKLCFGITAVEVYELALVGSWMFLAPLANHFATLTSLTITFALDPRVISRPHMICAGIPPGLTSLRTLRLWLPAALNFLLGFNVYRSPLEGMLDEFEAVRLAHWRCPSLDHVSLFHRVDWCRVAPYWTTWIPMPRGENEVCGVDDWLERYRIDNAHSFVDDLEEAETDSLFGMPTESQLGDWSSDDEVEDDEYDSDELSDEEKEWRKLIRSLTPPLPGGGTSEQAWADTIGDLQDPSWPKRPRAIAALLEKIHAVREAQAGPDGGVSAIQPSQTA